MLVQRKLECGIGLLTFARSKKRNAISPEMTVQIDACLNDMEDDPEVRAVVVTHKGPVFSAGTDLTLGAGSPTFRGGPYGITRRTRSKPLIAAVDGAALGGGFEIVLACDLVVASTNSTFGFPEVKYGVVPTCGGLFRGPRCLPRNLATELVLTGESIGVEVLSRYGFINRLSASGEAVRDAVELAQKIADNSPSAIKAGLRAIEEVVSRDDQWGWLATEIARREVRSSPDYDEGRLAFSEGRRPRWDSSARSKGS